MTAEVRKETDRRRNANGKKSEGKSDSHVTKKETIALQAKGHHHHVHEKSTVTHERKEKPQVNDTGHGHHPRRKSNAVVPDQTIHGCISDPVGDLQRHESAIKLQAAARGKVARVKQARKANVIAKEIAGY